MTEGTQKAAGLETTLFSLLDRDYGGNMDQGSLLILMSLVNLMGILNILGQKLAVRKDGSVVFERQDG